MATIVEVAALAGVSTATVSRVLNGKKVRPDLAEAVHRAAAELGYTPDRTARSLRRRHSDVIALVLPDIENPFFTSLARGVEDVAQEAGLSVVLCNTDEDPAKEERYLAIADSENMAGVLLAPATASPNLRPLLDRGRAVVVLDRAVAAPVDQVLFDNAELGRRVTRELVGRGHRRVGCISGPAGTSTADDRADGWRQALAEAGLDVDERLLVRSSFRVEGGRRAMLELLALDRPPEAVVATNNLVGVGALQVLAARGESAPEVGVIGDLPFVTSRTDDLVVLPLGPRTMGVTAARLLIERVNGLTEPPRTVVSAVAAS
ncbi:LacI family transcriptional regulator [Georgenia sp. EYE_87]|uniref:LacI family DNA-binding transcriptional regulator n=1 Tax=Georgenia sp. EYE_87 TaxID=2853448 RepID=UPI002003BA8A|nr:LacI family DNA-binding transcriptional regulator [Georgenia sp. EYE_87]MCK6211655.1 LacI family transcriptional regulator [Georgenia sp. EYE_87]